MSAHEPESRKPASDTVSARDELERDVVGIKLVVFHG